MSDLDAKHYRKNSAFQFGVAQDAISLHTFLPHQKILDIGCGDGRLTAQLAEIVLEGAVHGIDPSPAMISLAKETTRENLSYSVASAESDHGLEAYDLITAFSCLHWVRESELAFQKMREALVPGGRLLFVTYPKESPYYVMIHEVLQREKWRDYALKSDSFNMMSLADYQSFSSQFNVLHEECVDEFAPYISLEDYKAYVRGWLGCLVDIPSPLDDEFLEEVAQHAVASFKGNEMGFKAPYKRLTAYLEK